MDSTNLWAYLAKELGDDIGFSHQGISLFAASEKEMAECKEWLKVAAEHGMDTKLLSKSEANSMIGAKNSIWKGAMVTPGNDRAEPFTALKTLAQGVHQITVEISSSCWRLISGTMASSAG